MSTQRGNVKKKGPPKHQNKSAWKNVYHDTSKQTQRIINTEVSGVCSRCKDIIDWKIKYKKYKPLTQPKTCVNCKQKTVRQAYHTYCLPCATTVTKCAKCGEKKAIVQEPSLSEAQQASEDRMLQFELEMLPERKRRTCMRLQEKGLLTPNRLKQLHNNSDDEDDENDDDEINDDDADENVDQDSNSTLETKAKTVNFAESEINSGDT